MSCPYMNPGAAAAAAPSASGSAPPPADGSDGKKSASAPAAPSTDGTGDKKGEDGKKEDGKKEGDGAEFPVLEHIYLFVDSDGWLTVEGITHAHDVMYGIAGGGIKGTAIIQVLQAAYAAPERTRFLPEELVQIVNPARTRAWTDKGKFDLIRWKTVIVPRVFKQKVKAIDGDGSEEPGAILTDFEELLKETGAGTPAGTRVYLVIPLFWTLVTKGSITDFIDTFSDATITTTPCKKVVKAITARKMRRFYETGGVALFHERARKIFQQNPEALKAFEAHIRQMAQLRVQRAAGPPVTGPTVVPKVCSCCIS